MTQQPHATIIKAIASFSEHCEEDEYTDTGEAWELLDMIAELLRMDADQQPNNTER